MGMYIFWSRVLAERLEGGVSMRKSVNRRDLLPQETMQIMVQATKHGRKRD